MKKMVKKLLSLAVVFVLTLTASIFPVSAYPSKVDEDIPVIEMVEVADGIYEFEIPMDTIIESTEAGIAPLVDCSHDFQTTLTGQYDANAHNLYVYATVMRLYGTGLITFIEGTFDYTLYSANGTYITNGYDYDQRYTKEHTTVANVSADFNGVVASNNDCFVLSTMGNFLLVDGYGTFKAALNS